MITLRLFKSISASALLFAAVGSSTGCIGMYGNEADLVVDKAAAASTLSVVDKVFASTDCAMQEACVGGPGKRRLLRFDGVITNQGPGDLELGKPKGNPLFEYAACHDHHHVKAAMKYELLDPQTLEAVKVNDVEIVGRKQGFCMLDMRKVSGKHFKKFTCNNQGLTSGWSDIYASSLDCQWIDVTGVPAGNYILRMTVNPDGLLYEIDTSNNSTDVPVTLPDPSAEVKTAT